MNLGKSESAVVVLRFDWPELSGSLKPSTSR